MMKVYKFGMLVASVGLVFGLMTGCGGGGGTDSIIPLAETDSSTPSTEIEDNVFVQQNEYAQQSVLSSHVLYTAVNEELGLIEDALGEGWEYAEWTEDDIRSVLSEEEIEQLASQLAAIHNDKVLPSAETLGVSLNGLNSTEEEIQNLLNIATGFAKPIAFSGFEIFVAVTIISAVCAFGAAVIDKSKENSPDDDETAVKKVEQAIDWGKTVVDNVVEGTKAGITSIFTDLATFGTSKAVKGTKLAVVIDTTSDLDKANSFLAGVNSCLEVETPEKQGDIILNALDPAATDDDVGISYLGQSDEDGVFHNIPQEEMTFVFFSEGNVRSVTSCIDFSGDEELITENIAVTPIADYEDLIDDGDEVLPEPNTDSSNIQVNIPGYTNTLASNFTEMSLGALNDGPKIYPAFSSIDVDSPEELTSVTTVFAMIFNTTLSAGNTYLLSEDGDGNANVLFTTKQIVDEEGVAITFSEVSGSFTLTEYGTNVGDRLSGSFSCNVIGKITEDDVINGTISGTFSGTLSAAEENSAVSKSMSVSF